MKDKLLEFIRTERKHEGSTDDWCDGYDQALADVYAWLTNYEEE